MGRIKYRELYSKARDLLDMVGLKKNPKTEMAHLKVAEKQLVEVAKALSNDAEIFVMDEPTSALNEKEVDNLFKIIRSLKENGKSIIYISHKLDEIFTIADRVEVLRDGKKIDTLDIQNTTREELIAKMVGRKIDSIYPYSDRNPEEVVLEVEHLCAHRVEDVSFSVRSGEVVGLFGLMGAGRTEIAETIFGINRIHSGKIKVNGKSIRINKPKDAINAGMAYIPRERKADGLILMQSVKHNMMLVHLDKLMKGLRIDKKTENDLTKEWIEKLSIKLSGMNTEIQNLSGGNQQKVIVGKWMIENPKLLIMNEPTRGIDVGAKHEIYTLINQLCKNGMAVLIISSETPEIMGISDRIIVIHEGKITGECKKGEFSQEKIMHYAIGES